MSITDELREYAHDCCARVDDAIHAIADRIDAEHEESIQREHESAYDAGYADGMGVANKADMRAEYLRGKNDGYDEGFASADDWLAQHEDAMAEHGWVRLPVDGEAPCKQLGEWIEKRGLITGPLDHDGELWHKGDMSASPWGVIEGIVFENGKWFIRGHDTSAPWVPADSIIRYHEPTVEDVLREFAYGLGVPVADSYIAASAAKLRLAEEEDA